MAQLCIFCGAPATSRQHVWPKRYANRFAVPQLWEIGRSTPTDDGPPTVSVRRSTKFDLQVRCLCRPCNNEWAQGIEDAAWPTILPMFDGARRQLSRDDQRVIAALAMLMALVAPHATGDRAERMFTPQHRATFHRTGLPPPNTHIWLARYRGARQTAFSLDRFAARPDGQDFQGFQGYAATLTMGQLGFQIMTLDPGGEQVPRVTLPAIWRDGLVRIWPVVGGQVWPPVFVFDEYGWEVFEARFRDLAFSGLRW